MNTAEFRPRLEVSQKMTKERLHILLNKLELQYSINGEPNQFEITISLPKEHISEKKEKLKAHFLNDPCETVFDKEKIFPPMRQINYSTNLKCKTTEVEEDKYTISVSKK